MNTRPQRCALVGATSSRRRATASALTKVAVRSALFGLGSMQGPAIVTRWRHGVVCAVRAGRPYATGAPLQEPVQTLRVRKTSFAWTRLTKQTVSAERKTDRKENFFEKKMCRVPTFPKRVDSKTKYLSSADRKSRSRLFIFCAGRLSL